jgi:hypothetical protein
MKFFAIWLPGDRSDKSLAFLHSAPRGLGLNDYCMRRGERIGANYPADAKAYLEAKSPGIKLASLLGNTLSYLIVNTAMKDAILDTCKCEIEVLPFVLYNHKKRIHSKDYWIINPIGTFDCLNRDASDIRYDDPATKAHVLSIRKYVFDSNKLEAAPDLFRIPESPADQFVSERLVKALHAHQCTNILLGEIEQQPGQPGP